MKIETREIYKCGFCNKLYQRKHACIYHESICKRNPENDRPCFSCSALRKEDFYIEDNVPYSDETTKTTVMYCNNKNVPMYPPQSEIKKNWLDSIEDNQPMPKECDLKEEYFDLLNSSLPF